MMTAHDSVAARPARARPAQIDMALLAARAPGGGPGKTPHRLLGRAGGGPCKAVDRQLYGRRRDFFSRTGRVGDERRTAPPSSRAVRTSPVCSGGQTFVE